MPQNKEDLIRLQAYQIELEEALPLIERQIVKQNEEAKKKTKNNKSPSKAQKQNELE